MGTGNLEHVDGCNVAHFSYDPCVHQGRSGPSLYWNPKTKAWDVSPAEGGAAAREPVPNTRTPESGGALPYTGLMQVKKVSLEEVEALFPSRPKSKLPACERYLEDKTPCWCEDPNFLDVVGRHESICLNRRDAASARDPNSVHGIGLCHETHLLGPDCLPALNGTSARCAIHPDHSGSACSECDRRARARLSEPGEKIEYAPGPSVRVFGPYVKIECPDHPGHPRNACLACADRREIDARELSSAPTVTIPVMKVEVWKSNLCDYATPMKVGGPLWTIEEYAAEEHRLVFHCVHEGGAQGSEDYFIDRMRGWKAARLAARRSVILRTYREWPTCKNGGTINFGYFDEAGQWYGALQCVECRKQVPREGR